MTTLANRASSSQAKRTSGNAAGGIREQGGAQAWRNCLQARHGRTRVSTAAAWAAFASRTGTRKCVAATCGRSMAAGGRSMAILNVARRPPIARPGKNPSKRILPHQNSVENGSSWQYLRETYSKFEFCPEKEYVSKDFCQISLKEHTFRANLAPKRFNPGHFAKKEYIWAGFRHFAKRGPGVGSRNRPKPKIDQFAPGNKTQQRNTGQTNPDHKGGYPPKSLR